MKKNLQRRISKHKNVFNDKPLTRPLRVLKDNCKFIEKYNIAFNLKIKKIKKKLQKRQKNIVRDQK